MSEASEASCEVSLLLESVGLTVDKVLRCAAGIHEARSSDAARFLERLKGRNERGQCFGAEEILVRTPQSEPLDLRSSFAGA